VNVIAPRCSTAGIDLTAVDRLFKPGIGERAREGPADASASGRRPDGEEEEPLIPPHPIGRR